MKLMGSKKITESYFYRIFISFFVSCMVFAAILVGTIGFSFYRIYLSNLKQNCIDTVENVRNAVGNEIANGQEALRSLARDVEVKEFFEGTRFQDENTVLRALYILKNGNNQKAELSVIRLYPFRCLSTSEQTVESFYTSFENWGVFRKANMSDDVALYAVAKDSMLNARDRISMAKAYRDGEGRVLGYVLVEIPRSTIDAIVNEYSGQYKTIFMLLNRNQSIIYHSSGVEYEGLGKAMDYGLKSGATDLADDTYAYSLDREYDLWYVKELPAGVMQKIMSAISKAMILGLIIIAGMGLVLSGMLARSVQAPIYGLQESMARVMRGDLTARVKVNRKDEIGKLGESFNSMTERIEELMANIDEEKHSLWIAETRSLSLQMNPHFLYNTLDLIKWNVKLGRTEEVADIVVQLGRLLRRIMNTKADLVKVSYEMEIIQSFLEIQRKHYGERLRMETDLQEGMENELIPKLILQPMVENAIVHGFSEKDGECVIRLTGSIEGEYLIFQVEDNGMGMDPEILDNLLAFRQEGSHHIGLNNVQRRARLFGDERCGISAVSEKGKGTRVTLKIRHLESGIGLTHHPRREIAGEGGEAKDDKSADCGG